jgi:putative DNA primase/helicase
MMLISENSLDRARQALSCIPPDLDRESWVKLAMGAHAAGVTLEEFDAWSAGGTTYDSRAVKDLWRSIKPEKGIGPGTLFRMAHDYGGLRVGSQRKRRPLKKKASRAVKVDALPQHRTATAVWARCLPVSEDHPYLRAKAAQGVPLGDLREVPSGDPLRIQGHSMVGALVVPCRRPDGSISSLQFITVGETAKQLAYFQKATKPNLPSHTLEGWFTVGDVVTGGRVFVCEGIGAAWACWLATGHPAAVCFGWGRVHTVAKALRQQDPTSQIVLVPDVGKEDNAMEIAREVRATVAAMPEGWPSNSDVCDFSQREGVKALGELLGHPRAPTNRFQLLGSSDLREMPPMAWRIRGVLPAEGLAAFFGQSRAGKSFLVLDAACAIAEGRDWFGHRVTSAPVVYVALEGQAGYRVRVRAWEKANGRPLPSNLKLVFEPFNLVGETDVEDLASAILELGPTSVVILDTLSRASPGLDENGGLDMGRMIEAASKLQKLIGGLVVLVHHTGKDQSRGLRGHSSLMAALDAAVEVIRDGQSRKWVSDKVKEGRDGVAQPFLLETVEVGVDEDGEPETSCVVRHDSGAKALNVVKLPQGGNQSKAYQALAPLFLGSQIFGKGGAPSDRPCIELFAAVEAAATALTCDPGRRKERAREAISSLVEKGFLGLGEGWVWQA